ncbi:MAG: hypothetical protein HUJ29_11040 [Gammaproteobacteria bacterium]|nr:hypothetical protein [Gammaproteobacteria bacterium]
MKKIIIILSLICISRTGLADQFHYNDILIGDRASGLGGAYTAVSDDPSGMFYNPAGIVYAPETNTSSSALAYQAKDKTYKNVIGGNDWIRRSTSFVPNFFGVLQPVGSSVYGISFAMPEAVDEHQAQTFSNITGIDEYSIDLDEQDTIYKVGPSFASWLTDSLSYGVTLYFHSRERITSFNQVANLVANPTDSTEYDWTNLQIASSEFGIEPVFGLMWSPTERTSFGASVRKVFVLSAQTREECTKQALTAGSFCGGVSFNAGDYKHVIRTTSGSYIEPSWETRLGWATFPNSRDMYSADFNIHYGGGWVTTWNAALGYEHFFSARWNARLGLYTNNANTGTPTASNALEHIDEIGTSLSIGRFTRTSSVSVGISYLQGSGTKSGLNDIDPSPVLVDSSSMTFFLSAYYTN